VPVLEDALACGVAELPRTDVCVAVLATGVPAPIEVLTSGVVGVRADSRVVALPAPMGVDTLTCDAVDPPPPPNVACAAVTVGALVETLTFVVVPPADAATEAGEPTPAERSAGEGIDAVAGAEPAPNVAATGVRLSDDVAGAVPGILKDCPMPITELAAPAGSIGDALVAI
jgi:hypothetical protein